MADDDDFYSVLKNRTSANARRAQRFVADNLPRPTLATGDVFSPGAGFRRGGSIKATKLPKGAAIKPAKAVSMALPATSMPPTDPAAQVAGNAPIDISGSDPTTSFRKGGRTRR